MIFISGIILIFSSLSQSLFANFLPAIPTLLVVGLSLVALNVCCLPPSILLLGTSTSKGFSLLQKFDIRVSPLKLIHLFDIDQAHIFEQGKFNNNNYRVFKNWAHAVEELCLITPLIVLDAREISDAVRKEANFIFSNNLQHKTIFISDEYGRTPLLSTIDIPKNSILNILTLANCSKFLKKIGFAGITLKLNTHCINNYYLKVILFTKDFLSNLIISILWLAIAFFYLDLNFLKNEADTPFVIIVFVLLLMAKEFFFFNQLRSVEDYK